LKLKLSLLYIEQKEIRIQNIQIYDSLQTTSRGSFEEQIVFNDYYKSHKQVVKINDNICIIEDQIYRILQGEDAMLVLLTPK
jgi:hypothetical protein